MSVYQNLMSQLGDSGALFNVETETLMTGSGSVIPGKRVIVNKNNNTPVGIVSDRYRVVSNEEIFNRFCREIEASNINTEDARVDVAFAKGGARTLVDFTFPAESIKVPGDDSSTILSITALNSFDGSTRYVTKAGGLRLKCLNGQLLGTIAGSYSALHNEKLSVEEGASRVIRMLQEFREAQGFWGKMLRQRVGQDVAHRVITEFFNTENNEDPMKNRNVQYVSDAFRSYSKEMGSNAYSLYNAFTDFISHKKSKQQAVTRVNNERKLFKLIKTDRVFTGPVLKEAA